MHLAYKKGELTVEDGSEAGTVSLLIHFILPKKLHRPITSVHFHVFSSCKEIQKVSKLLVVVLILWMYAVVLFTEVHGSSMSVSQKRCVQGGFSIVFGNIRFVRGK